MSYLLSGEIFDKRRGTDVAKIDRVSVIGRLECHKEMHSKNAHYTTKQYSTKGKRDRMAIFYYRLLPIVDHAPISIAASLVGQLKKSY